MRRRRVLGGLRRPSCSPSWGTVPYVPTGPPPSLYNGRMARRKGPCVRCGQSVDRVIRPGRERLCLPCAVRKATEQHRAMAMGTHPDIESAREAGREVARQIEAREGPWYERWRRGMAAAAER